MEPSLPGIPLSVLTVSMEDKYRCHQCHLILRKPIQAQCGHRFCLHCFKLLISAGPKPCEACRDEEIYEEPQSILNNSEAFPDNAAWREIGSLPAKCLNESSGCSWSGTIKQYETQHEGWCKFDRVECNACRVSILKSDKEKHSERECEARTLNCKYCKVAFNFKEIKVHDEICVRFPMQCKNCGKKKIPREKFNDHTSICSKSNTPCPFNEIGCKAVFETGKTSSQHEQSSVIEHMRLLLAFVRTGKCQEDSWLDLYQAPHEGTELGRSTGNRALACGHTVGTEHKLNALENIVCVLNREVERSLISLEAASYQHRMDQDKIENLANEVRELKRTLTLRDIKLAETDKVLHELESSSYDGVFVWKIDDYFRRRKEAVERRVFAIFSPPFYTSKHGYKMCLRLYLNGDGTGRGTHLSLFFTIMRGKFDAVVKWPFSQKVTLMLLNQNNREHAIDSFRPDVNSTSFLRPISEMNLASGCPLFCPLAKLTGENSYLKDDTIFIKAIVDLTGL